MSVYEIVYKPWENNKENKPWRYIGSTTKDLQKYFGSIKSKIWSKFWVTEVKNNPENFEKRILCNCIVKDENNETLRYLEYTIQKQLDILNNTEFFNRAYAIKNGFFGVNCKGKLNPRYGKSFTQEQRDRHSIIMKQIGERKETKEKRSISQKNAQNKEQTRLLKSLKQKEALNNYSLRKILSEKSKKKVILEDCCFFSAEDFDSFLKENNLCNKHRKLFKSLKEIYFVDIFLKYKLNRGVYKNYKNEIYPEHYKYKKIHTERLKNLTVIKEAIEFITVNSSENLRKILL